MNSYIISLAMIALKICSTVLPSYAARPFVTDDAGTVALETFELETGVDFWKDAATGCIGLKHGVTNRMDIGFGFGYAPLPEDERGFSGAELGLKFAIVPELLAVTAAGRSVQALRLRTGFPLTRDSMEISARILLYRHR